MGGRATLAQVTPWTHMQPKAPPTPLHSHGHMDTVRSANPTPTKTSFRPHRVGPTLPETTSRPFSEARIGPH